MNHEELEREIDAIPDERLRATLLVRTFERDTAEAEVKRLRGIVAEKMDPTFDAGNNWEGPGPYPGKPRV